MPNGFIQLRLPIITQESKTDLRNDVRLIGNGILQCMRYSKDYIKKHLEPLLYPYSHTGTDDPGTVVRLYVVSFIV